MLYEGYSERVASYGFISGLILGQIVGIVFSFLTELDVVSGIVNGAGAGVVIAMIPAYMLINRKFTDGKMIIPFAMGWGTVVGIMVGLAVAWARGLVYMGGFSYGSIGGLVTGTAIGLFLWWIPEDDELNGLSEEEFVEISE